MIVTAGKTNVSVYFYIVQDASATSPGEPVTGLLFSDIETGGSASYVRQGALRTDLTLITLASASAAHADGGFILVDDTNMPGLYRCDYPDAVFATAVDQVMLQIVVASGKNAVASPIFVDITDVDLRDSVRGGMTSLPNAAADAGGGLPISDAGGLNLDTKLANTNEITVARMGALTDWIDGNRLDLLLDAIPTTAMRGTDSAALASVCTEARLAELDAANLPTVTDGIQTDLSNATDGLSALKALIDDVPTVAEFNARTLVAASYFDPAADTVATVTTTTNVTNQVTADMTAISGDAPAADNLESMYDGTGYIDDTAPASRAQVDGIGTASGTAFTIAVSEDNVSTPIKGVSSVGTETGTFANTEANDGVYHVITHVTNDIDWIYGFDIGGGRTASSVIFKGFLNSNNDAMLLQAFDFVGSDWETIAQLPGQNGSINITLDPSLLLKHTGTGADLGKVFLRFEADGAMTSPVLNVDLLTVSVVNIGQSIGYASGQIWVDTLDGTAGTEVFVNGVADNAVLTWADALTLSSSIGITDFHIINGSTAQLTANSDNFSLFGDNWTLDMNGQSTIDAHFEGATISGVQTGVRCGIVSGEVGIVTLGTDAHVDFAALTDVITLPTGNITFDQCHMKGTSGPTFDFGAAVGSTTAHIHHYAGLLSIDNLGQLGTDIINLDGKGKVTIKATCIGGTINLRGNWEINDLAGGAVTVIQDDLSTDAESILIDTAEIGTAGAGLTDITLNAASIILIWDEPLSGHNIGGSSGKTLKTIPATIIRQNTAQGPGTGNNQIQLDTGASAIDGTHDPSLIFIISGTGSGQCRNIFQYDGTTKTATVDRNWKVNPDATSEFIILADAGREHVNEGLAQAATANTITLNTLASAFDNVYIGQIVFIRSGTGDDQVGTVIAYNGTTKVATVHKNWAIIPDTTSAYAMLPSSPVELTDNTIGNILTKQMIEAYAADGAAPTLTEALMLIQQSLHEFAIVSTTRTVKKLDGAATAAIFTLDDATNPTSTTRTT